MSVYTENQVYGGGGGGGGAASLYIGEVVSQVVDHFNRNKLEGRKDTVLSLERKWVLNNK